MTGGKAPRQTGKAFEAGVAKRLNGRRAGFGNASTEVDVITDAHNVECKVMSLPAKLEGALATVKARGKGDRLNIVVLKPKGEGWESARVYLSFLDFKDWYV